MAVMQATRDNVSQGSPTKPLRSIGELLRRVVWVTVLTALVVASLLTFPSSIPWMIACWLSWHTIAAFRGKPGWLPLLTCVAILLVKRIYWPAALVGFAVVACAVAVGRLACPKARLWQGRLAWWPVVALWMAWGLATLQWHAIATCSRPAPFDPSRSVVCIGDSLTSGLLPDPGYPAQLQKMIRCPVSNLGQSGITSEDGLTRLSRVAELKPPAQAVVIELGGHDFLKGWPRATTKQNLKDAIAYCRALGAEVLLMEIPRGFMTDPYWGLEREIAHETDVHLVSDSAIRQLVLWSPVAPPGMWLPGSHLSDDGLHANPRGSEYLARHVAQALRRMYRTEIGSSVSARAVETSGRWRVAGGK